LSLTLFAGGLAVGCGGGGGSEEGSGTEGTTVGQDTTGSPSTTDTPTTDPTTGPGPAECGNGVPEEGEECDNGADNADDKACKADCTANVCGDGKVGPGEGCDDGNQDDTDDCTNACKGGACGDGVASKTEACDDGNADNTDMCTDACTAAACGDGFVQPGAGEECDEKENNSPSGQCTPECTSAVCGDGFVLDGAEECDDGKANGDNASCLADCKLNVCGDGKQSPDEACDDGNLDAGDGCNAECTLEDCGDGKLDVGEDCDDMNADNDDGCTELCKAPACGDGFAQASLMEECDLGAENKDTGECTSTCKLPVCGDAFVQENVEQCDNGDQNGDDQACKADCTDNICGDGAKGPEEECDDGNADDSDLCTTVCKNAKCGDAVVQPMAMEECDLGDMNSNTGECTLTCKNPVCGDGFAQMGVEECDDGNMVNTDACVMGCKTAKCGDGFALMGTEECDDGNAQINDGCSPMCKLENVAIVKVVNAAKAIVDDAYTGTQATMACIDLQNDKVGVVKGGQVILGMDHTWIGDLTIKLFSPGNAKTLTLMSRPGVVEAADNGTPTSFENSDLAKTHPVLFRDGGMKDAEQMGDGLLNSGIVCKDDAACDYFTSPGKGPGLKFTDFNGVAAKGLWKLCVGDGAPGDIGKIDAVTLTLIF